jgi:hypothetical protein
MAGSARATKQAIALVRPVQTIRRRRGKLFYDAVSATGDTFLTVTGVTNCTGPEGVAGGTDPDSGNHSSLVIYSKMLSECGLP